MRVRAAGVHSGDRLFSEAFGPDQAEARYDARRRWGGPKPLAVIRTAAWIACLEAADGPRSIETLPYAVSEAT